MATQENVQTITREALLDLTAKQYTFVDIDSADKLVTVTGAGANAIGVLLNKPDAGEAATVGVAGVVKCFVGTDTITGGMLLQADAAGEVIEAAASDWVVGRALTGGGDGEVIEVLLGANHLNIA